MYQISGLQKFPNLIHGFSTVDGGNMSFKFGEREKVITAIKKTPGFQPGDELNTDMSSSFRGNSTIQSGEDVIVNRELFLRKLDINTENCVCLWVMHGDRIYVARKKDAGISMKNKNSAIAADCLVTNEKELYLFVLTGDCLPIILYSPTKQAIGVVHAGWKGVDLEIVKKAIKRLSDRYKTNPKNLIVGLGPAARKESYIKENPNQVNSTKWKGFMEKMTTRKCSHSEFSSESGEMLKKFQHDNRASLYRVDFVGLCKKQLLDSGVKEENIFDCAIDTVKDERFFSHYRDKDKNIERQGRFACVVGIR